MFNVVVLSELFNCLFYFYHDSLVVSEYLRHCFRFILGAVSPAVVVPSMLSLQLSGYGTQEGIPTLVMAASSCDDVLAISMFSMFLGIAFSQGILKIAICFSYQIYPY